MKNVFKKLRWFLLGGVCLLVIARYVVLISPLGLADIRPKGSKPTPEASKWYQRALKAHGGYERWQRIQRADVAMTAMFSSGLLRRALGPFQENRLGLTWRYTPSQQNPVVIKETKSGKTYTQTKDETFAMVAGQRAANPNRLRFFVRSIRHLMDFVFAMKSATIVHDAGEATWKGQRYARVYMTWKTPKANHKIDQYILWINKKTHLMDRFDCTGRQVMPWLPTPFIVARVEYKGYKRSQGFTKPASIIVHRRATQDMVHGYKIHKLTYALPKPDGATPALAK